MYSVLSATLSNTMSNRYTSLSTGEAVAAVLGLVLCVVMSLILHFVKKQFLKQFLKLNWSWIFNSLFGTDSRDAGILLLGGSSTVAGSSHGYLVQLLVRVTSKSLLKHLLGQLNRMTCITATQRRGMLNDGLWVSLSCLTVPTTTTTSLWTWLSWI